MKNKLVWKFVLLFVSCIPFLLLLPEWLPGLPWFDSAFMVLSALLLGFLVWRRHKEALSHDWYGLLLAVPAAAAALVSFLMMRGGHVHTELFLAGGTVLFGFGMLWVLFGWRLFYRLFPVPLLLMLSFPTDMAKDYFPGITPQWKFAIAAALCIYALFALLTDFNPIRRRTAFFAGGVILYALLFAAV